MQVFNKLKTLSESGSLWRVVIGILVFGSIWGLVEATLGGSLHLIHFTYKGAITGGIGMSIMAAFVVMYRRPKLAFCIAVIAALFKPLSAVIYGQPIFAPFVVNPASAILLEGLAFSLVVSLLFKRFESSIKMRIGAGVAAGYLSIILFGVLASAVGMGNWASWGLAERVSSVFANGTGLAIVGTCLLLLGHLVSMQLRPKFWQLGSTKPKLFYASQTVTIVCCWIIAVVALRPGL
jgi:hypothetical protein